MKMIRTLLLSTLLLSCLQVWPDYVQAGVCQSKTAIVYGNGIYNDRRDAKTSLGVLEVKLSASPHLAEFEFKLAYADNGGATGPFSLAGLAQLHQAFVQRQAANDSAFWRWLGEIAIAPTWFKTMMNSLATATNASAYVNSATLQKQLTGDPLNSALQPGYRALLNQGMRVIIVAHSQGNFYANAAYDGLTAQKPAWGASLGIVAVASPDSRVAGGGPHITIPEDEVIAAVRILYPLTLSSTPASGFSRNMTELGSLTAWSRATFGHSFAQWYLAGTDTRNFILAGIINTRNALQPAAYDMIPQRVIAGTRVAPGPNGGIYVTQVGGGVIHIDVDGVVKAVPGIQRVDFVDAANNLYYSDVPIDQRNWWQTTAAATISKMDSNGIVSTVYNTRFQGTVGNNLDFIGIRSYDVAADGTVYVLDDTSYSAGYGLSAYHAAYKVKNGVTSKIAGAAPVYKHVPGHLGSVLVNDTFYNTAQAAIDTNFFFPLNSIREMNGSFIMTYPTYNGAGGPLSFTVDASGILVYTPFTLLSHANFDVCSNGNVVGSVLGGQFSSTLGLSAQVSSVALSQDDNDLYYVDSLTSSVMKFVGRSR